MTSSSARAEASRRNGARSRGPVTAAGKARSARNAVKHGLRARSVVLADERAGEFSALASALRDELAPAGALQAELVARVAAAAWRARRVDRLEAALLERQRAAGADLAGDGRAALGAGLIRDGNGPRALETLVRYRGSVLAELFRSLGALKALQAEAQDVPASARRCSHRPSQKPDEPEKARQNNALDFGPSVEWRHDAPGREVIDA
jgi:hypothetical protein